MGYKLLVCKRYVVMIKAWISQSEECLGEFRRQDEVSQNYSISAKREKFAKFAENSETVEGFCCVKLVMGLNGYLTGDGNDDGRTPRSEVIYSSLDVHD